MPKYGKTAQKEVRKEMHELKSGKKRRGGHPKNREQAIAIGLNKAREKGAKVPSKK